MLLQEAKELNKTRWNLMGRDLQKAIKDTIIKYKEINFGIDSPICLECSNEPQKQQLTMR